MTIYTSEELLAELVMDAKRVAAYGQRTGRLRDYDLLSAIAAVDRLSPLTWTAPEVVTLQAVLNRAVQAISPTSISDLRSDWDPFESPRSKPAQLTFIFATLLLMIFTAIATLDYNQGQNLITGIESLQDEDPRATSMSILRRIMAAVVLADARSDNTQESEVINARNVLDETQIALINDLHRIDDRLDLYITQISAFRSYHPLPNEIIYTLIDSVKRSVATLFGYRSVEPPDTTRLPFQNECATRTTEPAQIFKTGFGETTIGKVMADYRVGTTDIVCAEGLTYNPLTIPDYQPYAQGMKDWIRSSGLWSLPSLYGALGAALYYMRRILDTTIPDPPMIRIVHRVALGAFAGVIVTWFWAPDLKTGEDVTSIGVTAFTLAFLIGFSIEVLFAFLDRTVATLIEMARGSKAPPAAPPAQPQGQVQPAPVGQ